jgi:hypothetical protein
MLLGGVCWIIKAGLILLTNEQPPYLFEVAPLLIAIGLVALYARLIPAAGWMGRTGAILAILAFLSQLAALVYERLPNAHISDAEDFVFPYSVFVLIGTLGIIVGLILLGIETYRIGGLPAPWHRLPLGAAILAIFFSLTVVWHLEIPILLIGGLWVLMGYKVWQSAKGGVTFHAGSAPP